ncbi:Crp/Fnr family transcriptional regulator [Reichenbachiella versicolor]|uniref:Crp/Fnr family transcriptional regulator n=1 Tax=Reichenbachiella versicolor TaxID=1821036 RepID=UPI000D6E117B|nr:cyclic nucleotide-binding domain-containing protein [Reichenbachiella versicolor]
MQLSQFLKLSGLLTDDECDTIDAACEAQFFEKGDTIVKADSFSNKLIFIESGLIRVFYLKDGKDITHFFFDENSFVAPVKSIFHNESEPYDWVAVEPCQLKLIKYEDFERVQDQFPKLTKLALNLAMMLLDLFSQKLNLLQFETAADKYRAFQKMYPNLINRVSLGDTASFLGVTQQTLSVVRSQKN